MDNNDNSIILYSWQTLFAKAGDKTVNFNKKTPHSIQQQYLIYICNQNHFTLLLACDWCADGSRRI